MCRCTTQNKQVGQHVDNIIGIKPPRHPDGQCLAGELIDDVQHPDLAAIMRAVLDKVVGPDMIWSLRLQPDAGAVVEP